MDIKKLSKEEKLRLYDLIQEKKRRLRESKSVYKPNSGQKPIHESTATVKFCASGNGSGKTTAAVHEAVWAAHGYHPVLKKHTKVPASIAVVLDKPDKADSVWLPEMRKWFNIPEKHLHKRGKPNTTQVSFDNGSTITFYSHEMDPLSFESIQIDAAVYDEPPPRHVFIGLRRGARKKDTSPWHLIIGTPLAAPWLRTDIWEPWSRGELNDTECFRMSSDVNKDNINWEEQQRNFAFMNDKERNIRREGHFFDLEGQALAHLWKRDTHIMENIHWEDSWPCVVAVDPHPSKKHVAVLLGVDRDNQLVVLKEMADKATARDFARALKKWYNDYRVIDIVVDSLGSQDMTSGEGFKSFIQVLNEEGIRARATTYDDKNDEAFISRIQDALRIPEEANNFGQRIPKLRVNSSCRGVINDIEQVQWTRDKRLDINKPKLDIQNCDYLACLKYALACNLFIGKGKAKYYVYKKPLYGLKLASQRKAKKLVKQGLLNERPAKRKRNHRRR